MRYFNVMPRERGEERGGALVVLSLHRPVDHFHYSLNPTGRLGVVGLGLFASHRRILPPAGRLTRATNGHETFFSTPTPSPTARTGGW